LTKKIGAYFCWATLYSIGAMMS